jgi:thiol-disulfide isomerase/thioredoxin
VELLSSAGTTDTLVRMFKKALTLLLAIAAGGAAAGFVMYQRNAAPTVPAIADLASSKPIVVKLHARWCPKCMLTKSVWSDVEKEYAGRVHLVVMDFTNQASTDASRREAHRLGLERFFEEFSGATGIVVVLHARTKAVAAELEFSRDLPEYRAAIDAALAAAKPASE